MERLRGHRASKTILISDGRNNCPKDACGDIAQHQYNAIVAWAFRGEGFDTLYALTFSACLLVAMATVLATPKRLKLPVAVTFYLIAIGLVLCWLGAMPGPEWFVPALFVKLLVGHLVP